MTTLVPHLRPRQGASIPTFADLRQVDGGFFRRGRSGSHKDELPDELHELFWSKADNTTAMTLLGHHRSD